jgi:ligand-binding sensor domain-containing protein
MQKFLLALLITFTLLFFSCKDEPPVIPGLTKSKIIFITEPDSTSVMLNNTELENVTPIVSDDIEPGFYRIDLKRFTYIDTSFYYVIRRNVTDTIMIEMREDPPYWWTTYNTSNSQIPTNQVSKVRVDNRNNKWIGTSSDGLLKFDGTSFTVYNTSNSGIPDNSINDIYIEDNGILWVSTREGFAKFDGINWTTFNQQNLNLPDNYITSIVEDKTGIYWIGTLNGGLIKFDGVEVTIYNYSNSGLPLNYVSTITVDENNLKWIGTWGEGLATFDGTNWKVYNSFLDELVNPYVSRIIIDAEGNKWIATGSQGTPGGLSLLNENGFINYLPSPNALPGGIVTDLAIDEKERLWISTENGLARFDGSNWEIYNSVNSGISSNLPVSVTVDLNQNKWIAGNGLSKYTGGKR